MRTAAQGLQSYLPTTVHNHPRVHSRNKLIPASSWSCSHDDRQSSIFDWRTGESNTDRDAGLGVYQRMNMELGGVSNFPQPQSTLRRRSFLDILWDLYIKKLNVCPTRIFRACLFGTDTGGERLQDIQLTLLPIFLIHLLKR
jgi:hypothetical protein